MRAFSPFAASSAAASSSYVLDLGDYRHYSVHVDFSGGAGDLIGNLDLFMSNDDSDYITLGVQQAVTSSSSKYWNVSDANYRYVKIVWTYSSGTGNWRLFLCLKPERVVTAMI